MTRMLTLLLLAIALLARPTEADFDLRVLRMQTHWDRFVRAYWGCTEKSISRADCNATLSRLDRKEFEASRRAAMDLFHD